MGMKTCLLSNNKEPRVKAFADLVGSAYIHKAGKPGSQGYEKAMELMGTDRNHTLCGGPAVYGCVYGANRAGHPEYFSEAHGPKEEVQIVLKRYLEKPVLYFYKNMP